MVPEGTCPVPSALRKIESTTLIFAKLVAAMKRKGTTESAASATIVTTGREPGDSCAAATEGASASPTTMANPLTAREDGGELGRGQRTRFT